MEFRQYWEIILRHKVLVLSLILCASVAALAATYILPERFTASALVLIRPVDPRRLTDPAPGMSAKEFLGFPLNTSPVAIFNKSYAEIIQSRAIAKQILDELHLDQIPEPEERGLLKRAYEFLKDQVKALIINTLTLLKYGRIEEGDPYEGAIDEIQGSLSAQEIRDTYLIQVEAKYYDPKLAALIANAAAKAFVDFWSKAHNLESEEELTHLRKQLEASDTELKFFLDAMEAYKEKEGIVHTGLQIEGKINSMGVFETRRRETENEIQELLQERKGVRDQLASLQKLSTSSTKVTENPLAAELKQILAEHEIDLAGLQRRFTPEHPDVMALQAKIDQTRKRLAEEQTRTLADETAAINPVYTDLEKRFSLLNARLPALEARRNSLQSTIDQYRLELENLRDKSEAISIMERKVEALEEVNNELIAETRDLQLIASKRPEEVRLVSSAASPLYPSGPIKIKYVGIAAGVSLLIGLALAFFLEYINIRIRTVEEAESSTDLPVLAAFPRLKSLEETELPEIVLTKSPQSPSTRNSR